MKSILYKYGFIRHPGNDLCIGLILRKESFISRLEIKIIITQPFMRCFNGCFP